MILALVFLIVVSLITISIAGLTAADLRLTSNFSSAQSMTAAADGATEVAINYARSNFDGATLNNVAPCNAAQQFNFQTVQAWCETEWAPLAPATRTVIVSTCLANVTSGVACESSPLVQAIVVFDDYPASSSYEKDERQDQRRPTVYGAALVDSGSPRSPTATTRRWTSYPPPNAADRSHPLALSGDRDGVRVRRRPAWGRDLQIVGRRTRVTAPRTPIAVGERES